MRERMINARRFPLATYGASTVHHRFHQSTSWRVTSPNWRFLFEEYNIFWNCAAIPPLIWAGAPPFQRGFVTASTSRRNSIAATSTHRWRKIRRTYGTSRAATAPSFTRSVHHRRHDYGGTNDIRDSVFIATPRCATPCCAAPRHAATSWNSKNVRDFALGGGDDLHAGVHHRRRDHIIGAATTSSASRVTEESWHKNDKYTRQQWQQRRRRRRHCRTYATSSSAMASMTRWILSRKYAKLATTNFGTERCVRRLQSAPKHICLWNRDVEREIFVVDVLVSLCSSYRDSICLRQRFFDAFYSWTRMTIGRVISGRSRFSTYIYCATF